MQKKHCKQLGFFLILSLLLGFLLTLNCPNTAATYSVPDKMAWWYDARFGMFIHFGSYSYLGHGEWAYALEGWSKANYQTQVSANFNPINFDATAIANAAKKAGMKYLVITAKHHEGFAMWNSQVASFKDYTGTTLYNLYNYTPFKNSGRDILMELKNACETAGIKFCLYYSILDWNHPSQSGTSFTTMASMTARASYITDMKAQLRELITKYQPAVLWFDGDWTYNSVSPTLSSWWTKADGEDLYKYVTDLDPNLIINERICRGFGIGDFNCPEQTVPTTPQSRQWETCQTMNSAWGYNASAEYSYKSVKSLIQELVTVVSRDGNYLLNIGPAGDGSVTPGSLNVLTGFQPWMATYSDSIYGTTGTPFMNANSFNEPAWGRYTKKTNKLFAHVFTWPTNGTLTISGISNAISKIYLMNNRGTLLSYRVNVNNIDIAVPVNAPDANVSVICIECS
ncbi:MAG TPA: alpha-L-fucosidase, partial [Bacillota bacterium]|nr:alpha-L-fucosidase [Bacillota bacterium]